MCLPAYLYGRVSVLDVVLQVAHQHQVAGLIPAGVQGVVVDVAEDSAGTDTVGAILGVDEFAEAVHDDSAVLPLALLLVLLGLNSKQKERHDSAFI